jgi:hypothetical protein
LKIAVIHDWLVTYAGAERALEQILKLYPDADLYSLVDFLPQEEGPHVVYPKIAFCPDTIPQLSSAHAVGH